MVFVRLLLLPLGCHFLALPKHYSPDFVLLALFTVVDTQVPERILPQRFESQHIASAHVRCHVVNLPLRHVFVVVNLPNAPPLGEVTRKLLDHTFLLWLILELSLELVNTPFFVLIFLILFLAPYLLFLASYLLFLAPYLLLQLLSIYLRNALFFIGFLISHHFLHFLSSLCFLSLRHKSRFKGPRTT